MFKKVVASVLGLGLLIAVGLGVAFYIKTKELKTYLQTSLNENFQKFADGFLTTWEPFECYGFLNVGCSSKEMTSMAFDDVDDALKIKFHDVALDFGRMNDSMLEVTAKVRKIEFNTQTKEQEEANSDEYAQLLKDIQPFLPTTGECHYKFERQNAQLSSTNQCQLRTSNTHLQLGGSSLYENPSFTELNIAQIMNSFYSKLAAEHNSTQLEDMLYALKDLSVKVTDYGLSEDAFNIYKKYIARNQADRESYVANLQGVRSIFGLFSDVMGEENSEQVSKLGDGLIALLSGEKKTLAIALKHKPEQEIELQPLSKIEENLLNKSYWKNYQFSVTSK